MDCLTVIYTDSQGWREFRKVPSDLHPSEYNRGILLGPPDLSELNLSEEDTLALSNALVDAGYMNYKSLAGKRRDLLRIAQSILGISEKEAAVLRLKLIALYQRDYYLVNEGFEND